MFSSVCICVGYLCVNIWDNALRGQICMFFFFILGVQSTALKFWHTIPYVINLKEYFQKNIFGMSPYISIFKTTTVQHSRHYFCLHKINERENIKEKRPQP